MDRRKADQPIKGMGAELELAARVESEASALLAGDALWLNHISRDTHREVDEMHDDQVLAEIANLWAEPSGPAITKSA